MKKKLTTSLSAVASAVLFFVAKRRQWNIRASLARASRRLTGRFGAAAAPGTPRRARGTGVRMVSPQRAGAPAQGRKRGFVVEVTGGRDVEKGMRVDEGRLRPGEKSWVARLWGNGWK